MELFIFHEIMFTLLFWLNCSISLNWYHKSRCHCIIGNIFLICGHPSLNMVVTGYYLQPNVLNLVSTNNFPLQFLDPSNSSDISFLDQMKFFIDHCVFNNGNIRQHCNNAKLLLITFRIPTLQLWKTFL